MDNNGLKISCYHCNGLLEFEYHHSGFGDETFFYCEKCGMTAAVGLYGKEMSEGRFYERFNLVKKYDVRDKKDLLAFGDNFRKMRVEISRHLKDCLCGGRFTIDAIPRCPICRRELEWDKIIDEIDKNSKRFGQPSFRECLKKGWHDIYYFVFNGRIVRNNWKAPNT